MPNKDCFSRPHFLREWNSLPFKPCLKADFVFDATCGRLPEATILKKGKKWGKAFLSSDLKALSVRVRAFVLLRWAKDAPAIALFQGMANFAQLQADRRPSYYNGLINRFYRICTEIQPSGDLYSRLLTISREELVNLVAEMTEQRVKPDLPRILAQFRFRGPYSLLMPAWQHWLPLSKRELGYNPKRIQRDRESLTMEELDALFRVAAQTSPRDSALIHFYIYTACRRTAAVELLVKDVYDAQRGRCREMGTVLEKFGKRFRFPIETGLANALEAHLEANNLKDAPYVFPALKNDHSKWNGCDAGRWLKRLAARAGIYGNHIHVHGLRHTCATLLSKAGNKIEDICDFLGHSQISMTKHYIDPVVANSLRRMHCPWQHADLAGLRISTSGVQPNVTFAGEADAQPVLSSDSETTSASMAEEIAALDELKEQRDEKMLDLIERKFHETRILQDKLAKYTNEYNFICSELLTDASRARLAEWQKQQEDELSRKTSTERLLQLQRAYHHRQQSVGDIFTDDGRTFDDVDSEHANNQENELEDCD